MKQPWVYMWGTHVHTVFNESHLPAAWTAVSLNSAYKNPGGATTFKCNFTAERPGSAVVSLQMSDNPLLSQTDRSCYFPSSRWDRLQESSYLSVGSNSNGYFKTALQFENVILHRVKKKITTELLL